jgi:hypothetical protein
MATLQAAANNPNRKAHTRGTIHGREEKHACCKLVISRGDMRVVYAIDVYQLGFSLFVCFLKELKSETNQD